MAIRRLLTMVQAPTDPVSPAAADAMRGAAAVRSPAVRAQRAMGQPRGIQPVPGLWPAPTPVPARRESVVQAGGGGERTALRVRETRVMR